MSTMSDRSESDSNITEEDSAQVVSIVSAEGQHTPPSRRPPKGVNVNSANLDDMIATHAPWIIAGVMDDLDSATFDIEVSIMNYRTTKHKMRRAINETRVLNAQVDILIQSFRLARTVYSQVIRLIACLHGARNARKHAKHVLNLLVRTECVNEESSSLDEELEPLLAKADVAMSNFGEALERLGFVEVDLSELICDMNRFTEYAEVIMGVNAP